jgi:uncharacterized membrane protein YgaE (UPF0421/DUF939 family)
MKYNPKNRMMEFSSDEEVSKFHDQLTGILRAAMLKVGGDESTSKEDDLKLTQEFFERYSVLTEALNRLRAHLSREADAGFKKS